MGLWQNISLIGVSGSDATLVARQKKLNNQVGLFTALATLFFIPYLYLIKNYYYLPFESAAFVLIGLSFLFNRLGYFKFSMHWRFFVVAANVLFASIEMPGAGFEFFLIPLGLIPFILSNHKGTQFSLLAAAIAVFFLRMFIAANYEPHTIISLKNTLITYSIVLLMVFVLCGLFIYRYKQAIEYYETLKQQQMKIIAGKNKDILDSIHYARRIQNSLLPTEKFIERVLCSRIKAKEKEGAVEGNGPGK